MAPGADESWMCSHGLSSTPKAPSTRSNRRQGENGRWRPLLSSPLVSLPRSSRGMDWGKSGGVELVVLAGGHAVAAGEMVASARTDFGGEVTPMRPRRGTEPPNVWARCVNQSWPRARGEWLTGGSRQSAPDPAVGRVRTVSGPKWCTRPRQVFFLFSYFLLLYFCFLFSLFLNLNVEFKFNYELTLILTVKF
jgi:hypothetical protein